MTSQEPLAQSLAALSRFSVGEGTMHETLTRVSQYAEQPVPPAAMTDADVDTAAQFGVQAAVVSANAQAYWDAHQLSQNLSTAMQSRAVIEQAKGILMGMQRCTANEAFQILVRASQREKRKLRDIADELVSRSAQSRQPPVARRAGMTEGSDAHVE